MQKPQKRITRRDVAAAAGVSTYTVSQAMAGRTGIAQATRGKVLKVAADLGYEPDIVAGLMGRRAARGGATELVLARVFGRRSETEQRPVTPLPGTTLEHFYAANFSGPRELAKVLWARGFHGICFHFHRFPWTEERMLQADWSRFSLVKNQRIYDRFAVHLVRHSAFDYARAALRELQRRGFRRIAVLVHHSGSEIDEEARLGAILVVQSQMLAEGKRLEWRYWEGSMAESSDASGEAWLRSFRPDAILSFVWTTIRPLLKAGWRFPRDAGFAAIMSPERGVVTSTPKIAGCLPQNTEIHQRWQELLCEMVARGERGFPKYPTESVVEPIWEDGETL